ncbi:MAG: hypothetical protein OXC82_04965 [Rhodobacteraceae bacterium]|nr:hypothetical protein [Paracoccaceae bacterium]MCY4249772.1 hypothetical protein [Paracoccaceae bacterium]MCY4307133.1 hypothetical protein [Paracoccaceae bacterium]
MPISKDYLKAGTDVNSHPSSGFTPLENVVGDTPDPEIVRTLLDAGARIPICTLPCHQEGQP